MIMLAILSLYFIYNGSNYLLIDEPNSHLDDYNSENLIENLRSIIEKFDYDIPIIIATANTSNLLMHLEGFFIYNIDTNEQAYSSDLIGNDYAIKRIFNGILEQQSKMSRNKEILLNILYYKKSCWSDGVNLVLKYQRYDDGNYPYLEISQFTKIEKIIYKKVSENFVDTQENYKCHNGKATLI